MGVRRGAARGAAQGKKGGGGGGGGETPRLGDALPPRVEPLRDEELRELVVREALEHGVSLRVRGVRQPPVDERAAEEVEDGGLGRELEALDAAGELDVDVEALGGCAGGVAGRCGWRRGCEVGLVIVVVEGGWEGGEME